jgi:hypothetical protein
MTMVAALPKSQDALLGPASQRLEIGLLGARAAAVLRRVDDTSVLDDADHVVLGQATDMLNAAADAVEFVAAGGRLKTDRKSFGFSAMAIAVELAAPSVPPDDLPKFLRAMAGDLSRVSSERDVEAAQRLLPAFSTLADVATRQAGSTGEGGGSLI